MYTQYDSTGHSHTRYSLEDHAWNAKADHVDSFSNFSKTNVKTNKWTNEKEGGFLELLKYGFLKKSFNYECTFIS